MNHINRASQQARREAERHYPVRVRIAVPPNGLGPQLALMHAWLDDACGGVVNDAIAFYFADAALAYAFVVRFCCGYRVETVAGAFAARKDSSAPRRAAALDKTP